jgi:2-oxo-4-hydroxy-4-carboxy--5-ureidoimidazoline (OHCU) decarboxylase
MADIPPRFERLFAIPPAEPVELSTESVDEFLAFAGRAGSEDQERIREMISAAREDREVVDRLFQRLDGDRRTDFGAALVTLSVIGELRRADALGRLEHLVWEELPEADEVGHGALSSRDLLEMLQSKAVEGISHLATDEADELTLRVIRDHPSTAVRSAAVDAFLFNHHDSDEAQASLQEVLQPKDAAFADRVRHTRSMDRDEFNAGLRRFYALHPEEVASEPGRPPVRRDDGPTAPPKRQDR